MTIETVRTFLGWCILVNFSFLAFVFFTFLPLKATAETVHGKLFGLEPSSLRMAYFQFFALYKVAILVFNVGPYVALTLMS